MFVAFVIVLGFSNPAGQEKEDDIEDTEIIVSESEEIAEDKSAFVFQEAFDVDSDEEMKNLLAIYMSGLPVDLVHASATVIFLWTASRPMLEKLERIKVKYGMIA